MMLARGTGNKMPLPRTVSFKRLEGLDLIIPSRRHGLRMILDNAAAAAGFVLKPRLEIDTLSAVCEIVASTELVTVLPGIWTVLPPQTRLSAHANWLPPRLS